MTVPPRAVDVYCTEDKVLNCCKACIIIFFVLLGCVGGFVCATSDVCADVMATTVRSHNHSLSHLLVWRNWSGVRTGAAAASVRVQLSHVLGLAVAGDDHRVGYELRVWRRCQVCCEEGCRFGRRWRGAADGEKLRFGDCGQGCFH